MPNSEDQLAQVTSKIALVVLVIITAFMSSQILAPFVHKSQTNAVHASEVK